MDPFVGFESGWYDVLDPQQKQLCDVRKERRWLGNVVRKGRNDVANENRVISPPKMAVNRHLEPLAHDNMSPRDMGMSIRQNGSLSSDGNFMIVPGLVLKVRRM